MTDPLLRCLYYESDMANRDSIKKLHQVTNIGTEITERMNMIIININF